MSSPNPAPLTPEAATLSLLDLSHKALAKLAANDATKHLITPSFTEAFFRTMSSTQLAAALTQRELNALFQQRFLVAVASAAAPQQALPPPPPPPPLQPPPAPRPSPPAPPHPSGFPLDGAQPFCGALVVVSSAPPPPPLRPLPHCPPPSSPGAPPGGCICGAPLGPGALAVRCSTLGCGALWHAACAGLLRGGGGGPPRQVAPLRRWRCAHCRVAGMVGSNAEGHEVLAQGRLFHQVGGGGGGGGGGGAAAAAMVELGFTVDRTERVALVCLPVDAGSGSAEFQIGWPAGLEGEGRGRAGLWVNGVGIRVKEGLSSLLDVSGFCGVGRAGAVCQVAVRLVARPPPAPPAAMTGGGAAPARSSQGAPPPPVPVLLFALRLHGSAPTTAFWRAQVLARRALPPAFAAFACDAALRVRGALANAALEAEEGWEARGEGWAGIVGCDLATCALAAARQPLAPHHARALAEHSHGGGGG